MTSARIVLADKQPLVRAGIRLLIGRINGMVVTDEVGSGEELLELISIRPPDIVVSEVALNGVTGIEVARQISRRMPQVKMLLLSAEIDAAHVHAALRAGVLGLVTKSGEPDELEYALRAICEGNPYLSPHLSQFAIERRRARRSENVVLPPRQREVLQFLGQGKSTKEIATLLNVSIKTVETHRSRLMKALEINNVSALLYFAVRCELKERGESSQS